MLNKKQNLLFISALAIIAFILVTVLYFLKVNRSQILPVQASIYPATHNVWGFAWNDSLGWISFNSSNCDTDGDGTYEGSNEGIDPPHGGPAPSGCQTSGTVYDYGIKIDKDGNLSADSYAWNEIGYIRLDAPGNPESDPNPGYPDTPAHGVQLEPSTNKFSGWARICSQADDVGNCYGGVSGWIKMAGDDYEVSKDEMNNFHGYAYSNEYGWISFNCEEGGAGQTNICDTSNFKVSQVTNVSGYAWSPNIGFISMNCANKDVYECGGGHFYGVNLTKLNSTFYQLKGYAWSNVGWINFAPSGPYPGAPNNSVYINTSSGTTTGWAKIESLGDQGWIKMSTSTFEYLSVKLNLSTMSFTGYAWNGNGTSPNMSAVGWISFSSSTPGAGGGDYAVSADFNSPPQVTSVNLIVLGNSFCSYSGTNHILGYTFSWNFFDKEDNAGQTSYEIELTKDGSVVYDQSFDNTSTYQSFTQPQMDYAHSYSWRVKVKDSAGLWSDWSSSITTTTPLHEYPHPGFDYFSKTPSAGEEVKFTSTSTEYKTTPDTLCLDGTCTFSWSTSPSANISSRTASSTRITFPSKNTYSVGLQITDGDGYQCSATNSVNAIFKLPTWRESK